MGLPWPEQLSDFDPHTDRVIRRGKRCFVVDTGGHRADVEVQSDIMTAEIAANLWALNPTQRLRMATAIRNTPLLSAEGKSERLKVLEERERSPRTWTTAQ